MKWGITFLLWTMSMIAFATDNTMKINVDKSSTSFVVNLNANPTTGYQWSVVDYDKTLFTLTGSNYQKPNSNLIGAGGVMVFSFALNKGKSYPDKANLVFKYARPWETKGGSVTTVTVNFVSGN